MIEEKKQLIEYIKENKILTKKYEDLQYRFKIIKNENNFLE